MQKYIFSFNPPNKFDKILLKYDKLTFYNISSETNISLAGVSAYIG